MARLFIGTLKGLPLNGSWSFMPALSRNGSTSKSSSWRDSSKMTLKYPCDSPCYKTKERRVNQSVCGEILEYGAPIFKWHDPAYTSRDLLSQPANHTHISNRSNSKHLKATSLTRQMNRRHSCKSKHVALNLLGNEVIRLLWMSRSTVTSEQSKSFHRYNIKDYLCLSSP